MEALSRYVAFVAVGVVGPGFGVQRLLRLPPDLAQVVPLGTAVAAGAFWLSLRTSIPWLFPATIVLFDLVALARGRTRLASGPGWRGAAAPFAAIVLLLVFTQYSGNRLGPTGDFLLDPLATSDTAFHVGLTHELVTGYPPQVPGVSGFPLGYHLGPDLVRAAALRWAGVGPFDSISRFDVTLGALALVLALRAAAQRLGGTALAIALAPWTLLATDFAFLFPGPQAHWWADTFRGNLLISLVYSNPVIPALALMLGCLLACSRYEAGEGDGWLTLAGLQAFAVPHFKVFLGAHLLLGLGVAFLLLPRMRRGILFIALPLAVSTTLLVLGQGGKTVSVVLDPLDLVRTTREGLGLANLSGISLALWSAVWLTASLGLRVLGLAACVRALRAGTAIASALASMSLAAWPLALLFRVSAPAPLPGLPVINDVSYLLEQGGPLLWLFTALAVGAWLGPAGQSLAAEPDSLRRGESPGGADAEPPRSRRVLAVAVVGTLTLPATLQFACKKAFLPPDPMPAPMVRAMDVLRRVSQPGDVVLQRPGARFPAAPVILAGRRVPYERFTPYLTQFASPEDLQKRHETVYRFFRTPDASEASAIAEELNARYLCLYGSDRVRFDATGFLEPLHEEAGARVYRLRRDQKARRP